MYLWCVPYSQVLYLWITSSIYKYIWGSWGENNIALSKWSGKIKAHKHQKNNMFVSQTQCSLDWCDWSMIINSCLSCPTHSWPTLIIFSRSSLACLLWPAWTFIAVLTVSIITIQISVSIHQLETTILIHWYSRKMAFDAA